MILAKSVPNQTQRSKSNTNVLSLNLLNRLYIVKVLQFDINLFVSIYVVLDYVKIVSGLKIF